MRSCIIWSKTFNCYSEFHASSEAIIRQLPEKIGYNQRYFKNTEQYILGVARGASSGILSLIK